MRNRTVTQNRLRRKLINLTKRMLKQHTAAALLKIVCESFNQVKRERNTKVFGIYGETYSWVLT